MCTNKTIYNIDSVQNMYKYFVRFFSNSTGHIDDCYNKDNPLYVQKVPFFKYKKIIWKMHFLSDFNRYMDK